MPGSILTELPQPAQFEATATLVREDDIEKVVVFGPDPEEHLSEIRRYISAGFDHVYVHQIGQDQEKCIRFYEQEILPAIQRVAA